MDASQAYAALWAYRRSSDCPDVTYAEGDVAIRCAIALHQGCVGLPKCNPAQCRCGAVRNPGPAADPYAFPMWEHVVVRV